jgi:hypothetical protein
MLIMTNHATERLEERSEPMGLLTERHIEAVVALSKPIDQGDGTKRHHVKNLGVVLTIDNYVKTIYRRGLK